MPLFHSNYALSQTTKLWKKKKKARQRFHCVRQWIFHLFNNHRPSGKTTCFVEVKQSKSLYFILKFWYAVHKKVHSICTVKLCKDHSTTRTQRINHPSPAGHRPISWREKPSFYYRLQVNGLDKDKPVYSCVLMMGENSSHPPPLLPFRTH